MDKNWKTYALGVPAVAALLAAVPVAPSGSAAPAAANRTTAPACDAGGLSVATSYWEQDSGQNMLIKATNTTGKGCTLYHYPYLYFSGSTLPVPPFGAAPKALATIRPHESAYAGVHLFRAGENTANAVNRFGIGYQGRVLGSDREVAPVDVRAPEGGADVGPYPAVTRWNLDRRAVEDIVFRSGDN
ncbi:DUF4232 domain-containing protein [Streptomyces beihaiensis]|uniref:DUF4232 domain-containing protein n=1 Tax=Streptomyces beihaiensis TaxID=2984495 RepID=A0ABT3U4R4_9ACTN|nr:DUF4232 domain-containing protein [Streptomyces beihaiensis]MCX3063552.1 DUF4232 domain-containing protein [Streptomyces beihaiensis]